MDKESIVWVLCEGGFVFFDGYIVNPYSIENTNDRNDTKHFDTITETVEHLGVLCENSWWLVYT